MATTRKNLINVGLSVLLLAFSLFLVADSTSPLGPRLSPFLETIGAICMYSWLPTGAVGVVVLLVGLSRKRV